MAELLIVLLLLAGAFAAGWFARGAELGRGEPAASGESPAAGADAGADAGPHPAPALPAPEPAQLRAAVDDGAHHLAAAIDAWLDDRGDATSEGRLALEGVDRSLEALAGAPEGPAADAAAALREARRALEPYGSGAPLDAATSRRLEAQEQALDAARARLAT